MLVNELETYIANVGKHYRVPSLDDYKQEVLLILFKKGKDFILELNAEDKLYPYVYKICKLLIYSKQGAYFIKFIQPQILNQPLIDFAVKENSKFKEDRIQDLINSLSGTDKTLLEQLIICRGNINCLSIKSKINYNTLNLMIKNLKEKIQETWQLEDFYE
tara:strand:+ start:104 stop:586 length:483 start_codon:yes stop_codon:yes gene_type:complete